MENVDPQTTLLPPALMAEVEAVAAAEQRPARELLREAVELYLDRHLDRRSQSGGSDRPEPRDAARRILERRKLHPLPKGMSIRDLMTHGRA